MATESAPLATEIKVDKKLLDMIAKFDEEWELTFNSGLDINCHIHKMEERSEDIVHYIRERVGLSSLDYVKK